MLALTRKVGEEIVIGDDVVVKIIAMEGDRVRLGIVAPQEVSVHRREVYEAIHGAGASALRAGELPAKPGDRSERKGGVD